MTRRTYRQPEVLATTSYSVGTMLSEEDGWVRVVDDLEVEVMVNGGLRRLLADGDVKGALKSASEVLLHDTLEVVDVAIVLSTGEVPIVFVRGVPKPVKAR